MSPSHKPIALLGSLSLALLPIVVGCGWWVWKGSPAESNANDGADGEDISTDGGDGATDGTASTNGGADGTDDSTPSEENADSGTCGQDSDCDDGLFCTGIQSCVAGVCIAGVSPCADGQACDEEADLCADTACATDADCDQGLVCQGGLCVADQFDSNGLEGLAVDADTGQPIDFAQPLAIGDTLTLQAPDPELVAARLPGPGCTCAWTVLPVTAGVFTVAAGCATDFTVLEGGLLTIAVQVTCAGRSWTFRQALTADAGDTPTACTTEAECALDETCQGGICVRTTPLTCTEDEECAEGETCQDGFCASTPSQPPSMTVFELQTRTPYVVRFDLWLKDGDGLAISEGVTAEHFRVYEDDARVDVTETNVFVTASQNLPLRVMLVLDYSNSMRAVDAVGAMIAAAEQFVEAEHFTGTHSIGVVEFHDRTAVGQGYSVAVPLTAADSAGKANIVRGIPTADSVESGLSRVWDAVELAVDSLAEDERQFGEVRAVVFLTDGRDTTSATTPEGLLSKAQANEVNLFPIGFGNVGDVESLLRSLADGSGGSYLPAADGDALGETFAEVARQLQGHWNLTYITPTNEGAVGVRVEFDWMSGTATVEQSFDASSLAGDVHQGVLEAADRSYDAALGRTEFSLRAVYMPRGITRLRLAFAHGTAIFNLQDAGGLTAPETGWTATPLGNGVFDLLGPGELEFGAFGNIGIASVPGDVPVLQVTHDDTLYAGLVQPKSMVFEGSLWALPYTLSVTIELAGTGSVTVSPQKSSYAHGETVTLTAVNGTKPFDRWSGDATGTTTPLTVIMDGDRSITASFADPP